MSTNTAFFRLKKFCLWILWRLKCFFWVIGVLTKKHGAKFLPLGCEYLGLWLGNMGHVPSTWRWGLLLTWPWPKGESRRPVSLLSLLWVGLPLLLEFTVLSRPASKSRKNNKQCKQNPAGRETKPDRHRNTGNPKSKQRDTFNRAEPSAPPNAERGKLQEEDLQRFLVEIDHWPVRVSDSGPRDRRCCRGKSQKNR